MLDMDLLSAYISNCLEVEFVRLNKIRESNNFVVDINGKYISRIRNFLTRIDKKESIKDFISRTNYEHENEVSLLKKIFHEFDCSNLTFNPIPEVIHTGFFSDQVISIYSKVEGESLDASLNDFCNIGYSLGETLSLVHKSSLGESERICQTNSSLITYKNYIDQYKDEFNSLCEMHETIYDRLVTYVCDVQYIPGKSVIVQGAVEPGHIFTNQKSVSGILDWEHNKPSSNGFYDIHYLYSNYVTSNELMQSIAGMCREKKLTNDEVLNKMESYADLIQDTYSRCFVFWENFVNSYICPISNNYLSNTEIRYIEFSGFLRRYYQCLKDVITSGNVYYQKLYLNLMLDVCPFLV